MEKTIALPMESEKFSLEVAAELAAIRPRWATDAPAIDDVSVFWEQDFMSTDTFVAEISRHDMFDGTTWDAERHCLTIWLMERQPTDFATTDEIRAAARNMLEAADLFDAAMAGE